MNLKKEKIYKYFVIMGIVVTFLFSFYLAIKVKLENAPDEYARFILVRYMYNAGKLPIGTEEEIVISIWGYSYAYRPYLFQIFSAIFMKIASVFTNDSDMLFVAMRFTSVLCYVGIFICATEIANDIFKPFLLKIIFPLMIVLWPQIVFLSSYINNDIAALFSVMLIIMLWIKGYKKGWSLRICVGLGIANGLCASSYYNAYVFILFSIVVFFYVAINRYNLKLKEVMIKALVVFVVAFIIGGWYFVRNYFILDGDFFGLKTQNQQWREHCEPAVHPDVIYNLKNSGLSLWKYLTVAPASIPYNWFIYTYYSLIAVFGYMTYRADEMFYYMFGAVLLVGIISYLTYSIKNKKYIFFNVIGALAVALIILLAIYYSCSFDFEPQGRYIITIVPVMLLAAVKGYEFICYKINNCSLTLCAGKQQLISNIFLIFIFLGYVGLSVYSLITLLIGNCFTI